MLPCRTAFWPWASPLQRSICQDKSFIPQINFLITVLLCDWADVSPTGLRQKEPTAETGNDFRLSEYVFQFRNYEEAWSKHRRIDYELQRFGSFPLSETRRLLIMWPRLVVWNKPIRPNVQLTYNLDSAQETPRRSVSRWRLHIYLLVLVWMVLNPSWMSSQVLKLYKVRVQETYNLGLYLARHFHLSNGIVGVCLRQEEHRAESKDFFKKCALQSPETCSRWIQSGQKTQCSIRQVHTSVLLWKQTPHCSWIGSVIE